MKKWFKKLIFKVKFFLSIAAYSVYKHNLNYIYNKSYYLHFSKTINDIQSLNNASTKLQNEQNVPNKDRDT